MDGKGAPAEAKRRAWYTFRLLRLLDALPSTAEELTDDDRHGVEAALEFEENLRQSICATEHLIGWTRADHGLEDKFLNMPLIKWEWDSKERWYRKCEFCHVDRYVF